MHKLVPEIFILQYHTEYSYMFLSPRDHHQGIKPKHCPIKQNKPFLHKADIVYESEIVEM
jgi:hypothetical protein